MKDLQRLFACLAVEGNGEAADHNYLRQVANPKTTFSHKLTLAMSSQSAWRHGPACSIRVYLYIGRRTVRSGR